MKHDDANDLGFRVPHATFDTIHTAGNPEPLPENLTTLIFSYEQDNPVGVATCLYVAAPATQIFGVKRTLASVLPNRSFLLF
jgi:hypothetical protein